MIKFVFFISTILAGACSTILTLFFDNFNLIEKTFVIVIIISSAIMLYMCNEFDKLSVNKKDTEEKLTEIKENKNSEISKLKQKLSMTLITANDNSPYTLQEYIENAPQNILNLNTKYTLEILASTLDSEYEIKYLCLSTDKIISIEQSCTNKQESDFILENTVPTNKCGKYEYSFNCRNPERLKTVGKCKLQISGSNNTTVHLVIELISDQPISKKKSLKLEII